MDNVRMEMVDKSESSWSLMSLYQIYCLEMAVDKTFDLLSYRIENSRRLVMRPMEGTGPDEGSIEDHSLVAVQEDSLLGPPFDSRR